MSEDIREKAFLNQKDIMGLNTIKAPRIYIFSDYRANLTKQFDHIRM